MGVTSRSAKKRNGGGFSFLLVMFVVVGIPFLTIKFCTSSSSKVSSGNAASSTVCGTSDVSSSANDYSSSEENGLAQESLPLTNEIT